MLSNLKDRIEENKEYLKSVIGVVRRNQIDWKNGISKEIEYEYYWNGECYKDVLKIREYDSKTHKVYFEGYERGCKTDSVIKCELGGILGFRTSEFKYEIGYTKNCLIIIDRDYKKDKKGQNWKHYKYKCNKCGNIDWIEENNLKQGKGCNVCSGRKAVYGIYSILDETPWMIDLGVSIEDAKNHRPQSSKRIEVKCPDCGKIKRTTPSRIYHTHSIQCSCGDGISYPEKLTEDLLIQLNVKYKRQYKDCWSQNKVYDFYLPDYNTIIETHGEQHYEESRRGRSLKEEQENDKLKEELALGNGIKRYIIIDCRKSELEYIKNNILDSELNKLFDLSKVDWVRCGEYATNNLIKKVCDYYNKHPEILTIDLVEEFDMSRDTIVKYLEKGTRLGWCRYNPKEEKTLNYKRNSKPVLQLSLEGETVGTYPSVVEASKQTDVDFRCISNCCNGRQKTAGGFIWKFSD